MKNMPLNSDQNQETTNSILSFSSQATMAYRFFTKEDFLFMMSDMSIEEIKKDLEKFKSLKEDGICNKLKFVIRTRIQAEEIEVHSLLENAEKS